MPEIFRPLHTIPGVQRYRKSEIALCFTAFPSKLFSRPPAPGSAVPLSKLEFTMHASHGLSAQLVLLFSSVPHASRPTCYAMHLPGQELPRRQSVQANKPEASPSISAPFLSPSNSCNLILCRFGRPQVSVSSSHPLGRKVPFQASSLPSPPSSNPSPRCSKVSSLLHYIETFSAFDTPINHRDEPRSFRV